MNRHVIGRFSRMAAYWRTFLQPTPDAVIVASHALPSRLCLATQSCFMPAITQHRLSPKHRRHAAPFVIANHRLR
jgi:hypothetical protein